MIISGKEFFDVERFSYFILILFEIIKCFEYSSNKEKFLLPDLIVMFWVISGWIEDIPTTKR